MGWRGREGGERGGVGGLEVNILHTLADGKIVQSLVGLRGPAGAHVQTIRHDHILSGELNSGDASHHGANIYLPSLLQGNLWGQAQ